MSKTETLRILEEMAEEGLVEKVGETVDGRSLKERTAFLALDPLEGWKA